MKINTLLFCVLFLQMCNGQNQQHCEANFRNYIFNIVEDSTNYWQEYPKPPKLTDNVLYELEKEIINDDSACYYLGNLKFTKYKTHQDEETVLTYLEKMDYTYSFLTLAVHWNPDVRLKALVFLNRELSIRPLVNSRKMNNGEWKNLTIFQLNSCSIC